MNCMLPKYHFALGLIPAALISSLNPLYGLLFLIGAVLIDFDHYVAYVLAFRDFSLWNAVNFFETRVRQFCHNDTGRVFLLFHNIETFVVLLIVSIYIPITYFLFFGMAFHYGLDLCYDYATFKRFLREFSIIAYIIKPNKVSLKTLKTPLKEVN